MCTPKIQNIVSTIRLKTRGQKLNLNEITNLLPNTEYNPERFSAMVMRVREPVYAVALLFSTGCLVCVGTKTLEDLRKAMETIVSLITKAAKLDPVNELDVAGFRVRNMVASFAMMRPLNLNALYDDLRWLKPDWLLHYSFNPEFFPGMCIRLKQRKGIVLLTFSSGKCVITGAHSEKEIRQAFMTVYSKLQQHLKQ